MRVSSLRSVCVTFEAHISLKLRVRQRPPQFNCSRLQQQQQTAADNSEHDDHGGRHVHRSGRSDCVGSGGHGGRQRHRIGSGSSGGHRRGIGRGEVCTNANTVANIYRTRIIPNASALFLCLVAISFGFRLRSRISRASLREAQLERLNDTVTLPNYG